MWTTDEWAAVVQAVGSVIGIGIAIYVPWKQDRNRRKEEAERLKRQAQAMAIYFHSDVVYLGAAMKGALSETNPYACAVEVPRSLTDRNADIWMLGTAGDSLLETLTSVSGHNLTVETARKRHIADDIVEPLNEIARRTLKGALDAQAKAIIGLEGVMKGLP